MANPRFPSVDENGEFESPEVRQRLKDHAVEEVKSGIGVDSLSYVISALPDSYLPRDRNIAGHMEIFPNKRLKEDAQSPEDYLEDAPPTGQYGDVDTGVMKVDLSKMRMVLGDVLLISSYGPGGGRSPGANSAIHFPGPVWDPSSRARVSPPPVKYNEEDFISNNNIFVISNEDDTPHRLSGFVAVEFNYYPGKQSNVLRVAQVAKSSDIYSYQNVLFSNEYRGTVDFTGYDVAGLGESITQDVENSLNSLGVMVPTKYGRLVAGRGDNLIDPNTIMFDKRIAGSDENGVILEDDYEPVQTDVDSLFRCVAPFYLSASEGSSMTVIENVLAYYPAIDSSGSKVVERYDGEHDRYGKVKNRFFTSGAADSDYDALGYVEFFIPSYAVDGAGLGPTLDSTSKAWAYQTDGDLSNPTSDNTVLYPYTSFKSNILDFKYYSVRNLNLSRYTDIDGIPGPKGDTVGIIGENTAKFENGKLTINPNDALVHIPELSGVVEVVINDVKLDDGQVNPGGWQTSLFFDSGVDEGVTLLWPSGVVTYGSSSSAPLIASLIRTGDRWTVVFQDMPETSGGWSSNQHSPLGMREVEYPEPKIMDNGDGTKSLVHWEPVFSTMQAGLIRGEVDVSAWQTPEAQKPSSPDPDSATSEDYDTYYANLEEWEQTWKTGVLRWEAYAVPAERAEAFDLPATLKQNAGSRE